MIVFVVRHANRTDGDDLSPAGVERSKLLARMLSESGVVVAFRSQYNRGAKTLEPLKVKLGAALEIRALDFEAGAVDAYSKATADAVRGLPIDSVVLVVGHSDTIGPTLKQLVGVHVGSIERDEFDKMFVVFVPPAGTATLVTLRYGEQN